MHEPKVNTNTGDLSSPEEKKASMSLVPAHVDGATPPRRRARRDLVKKRIAVREGMLRSAELLVDALTGTLFAPVDYWAERGFLESPPEDLKALRLPPEVRPEFNALCQQLVDFVRNAPLMRGPADRQSLQLMTKEPV
jgi:hypothetical protein